MLTRRSFFKEKNKHCKKSRKKNSQYALHVLNSNDLVEEIRIDVLKPKYRILLKKIASVQNLLNKNNVDIVEKNV